MSGMDASPAGAYSGGMAKPKLMGYREVAEAAGITVQMARTYLARARKHRREGRPRPGDLPEPDAVIGLSPAWAPATVERWLRNRPGQGKRTDLGAA